MMMMVICTFILARSLSNTFGGNGDGYDNYPALHHHGAQHVVQAISMLMRTRREIKNQN